MAWSDTFRDVVARSREAGGQASDAVKRQSIRARKEIEVKRLQGKIRALNASIGETVYSRVTSGELKLDIPEIESAVAEIRLLDAERTRVRSEIETILHPGDDDLPADGATGGPDGAG